MFFLNNSKIYKKLFFIFVFLLPIALQAQTDYSGTYFIASDGNAYKVTEKKDTAYTYKANSPATNFYLVPASDPQQTNKNDAYFDGTSETKPFLTTFKTDKVSEALWVVTQVTDEDGTFYYIKHLVTEKYVVYDPFFTGNDARRKCMHLEAMDSPTENAKFVIVARDGAYGIVPKSKRTLADNTSNHKFWNIADRNRNSWHGLESSKYYGGLVGLYALASNNKLDPNSRWMLEDAYVAVAPTITPDIATMSVKLTTPESGTVRIYYTTNGIDPDPDTDPYVSNGGTVTIGSYATVKARVQRDVYTGITAVSPITTLNVDFRPPTPTIAATCDNQLMMACGMDTAHIRYTYTTDGTTPPDPDNTSAEWTDLISMADGAQVKAVAYNHSVPSTIVSYTHMHNTAAPTYTLTETEATIAFVSGGTIYYTTNGSDPTNASNPARQTYSGASPLVISGLSYSHKVNICVYAIEPGRGASCPITKIKRQSTATPISSLDEIDEMDKAYTLNGDITVSSHTSIGTSGSPFTGTFNGNGHTISGLDAPLFGYTNNAEICNLMLDEVEISGSSHTGALVGTAQGETRIYNVGVMGGSLSATGSYNCGGIVGQLENDSRVVNCFSYADITGGNLVGGIVGNNNVASGKNTKRDAPHAIIMNCMFYGDITGGTNKAPIYNGTNIDNRADQKGVNTFNYFLSTASYVQNEEIDKYNSATAAEPKMLQRFEFFRYTLNSNRALAAWWAIDATEDANQMYKWVLLPDSLHSGHPYPILMPQGTYHSVVNYDPTKTYDPATDQMVNRADVNPVTKRNQGGKLGELSVTINIGSGAPTGAAITTGSKTLVITDKDAAMNNYNYGKVQLPYYNEVGNGNCTHNKVVTGWKITSINGGTAGSYSTGADVTYSGSTITATPYNFADRNCKNKDLYSVSARVFSQGAYWDVPEGVTAITIEPYWAKSVYLSDESYDVTYNTALTSSANVTQIGCRFQNGIAVSINGDNQNVYTSMTNAVNALFAGESTSGKGVYDYAVVLVGNYHLAKVDGGTFDNGGKPFTLMSADLDNDKEPDNTFFYQHSSRKPISPIRFDFINMPGIGMVQKVTGATNNPNIGIFQPKGWFEITNTTMIRLGQFEYDIKEKTDAPLILMGGLIDQMVSQMISEGNHTLYIHLGSNLYMNEFQMGVHQEKQFQTRHVPVSVNGGEYGEFHLTGTYRPDATIYDDNAECYINGGKFGVVSGAGNEGLGTSANKGNVTWVIGHADMEEFYGGGQNFAKPIKGNINTIISDSHVGMFCGGPKFGDMESEKTVTTTATNCVFGVYYGAGYGGNSYNRKVPANLSNATNYDWNTWITAQYTHSYDATYQGVATNFQYEFIPFSGGMGNNVARIMINHIGFSLATTHNVSSVLTGCTVLSNFYGGGNLGKVSGDVTSILTDCTIEGDAFGAGFSASLPKVDVMNTGGFAEEPKYLENAGIYQEGVFPATEEYSWEHADVVNNTATAINESTHKLYTTENLETLGTVTGNSTLKIGGYSTVRGSVFGGGEASKVNNNTEVQVLGHTKVYGNVYGGGNMGIVGGNAKVIINQNN